MLRSLSIALGAVLISTAATAVSRSEKVQAGEGDLAKLVEGRVAGKPVKCIMNRNVRDSDIIEGTAIVYKTNGNGVFYVNRPAIGGESLHDDDILITRTFTNQLCNLDTARLVARGSLIDRGFVSLGEFVPYTKPRR